MQSQEFHETFEKNRVCTNSYTENVTPITAGKDTCLNNNNFRYNSKKSFRRSYNSCFHVYVCRVNKFKDNCGCSGRSEALSEDVEKLHKDGYYWGNDDYSQNRKAKFNEKFCDKLGIKGLITSKKEKGTKYSCRSKPLPAWCENVTILNNNPTGNRIAETRLPCSASSNENDNLAINEISNLLTYLKNVGGENCNKTENWPNAYIPILEKCLRCEKEMALERLKKMKNHKNVCTKIDPNVDMFSEPKTICKKNKYFKGFCGRIFLRQAGSTSKSYSPRKEKITNTYITCFEKSPPKSCVIHKKITFTTNKKACKKLRSLNSSCDYATVTKYCDRNQTPCKEHLFMENMNKFLALNTLLEEKTEAEKAKILKCLANNGVCLPAAKTKSEKKIFNKVQKELRAMYKKTDKQRTNYHKSVKVNFLKPFRCKSYNVSTCTMSQNQLHNKENFERNCGHRVIKSSPIINNNNEKIYEIFPPPSRRQTVKGKIKNDFIRAIGRIKLKNVQTDDGDFNLLRKCSKKEKGLWYLIKNNCRATNRAVMVALTTPNNESCAPSSFLKKTWQCCQCDGKKCNENHSIIKIELSPYIYPLGEDENGNTKRLLYNSKNVKVTIARVKVQSMWQLKYFKNLVGKSNATKLSSKTIDVKGTCSFIYRKPYLGFQQNKKNTETYERKKYWTNDFNLMHTNVTNERKLSEISNKNYLVLQISQSAVDLKTLASTSSNITVVPASPSCTSLSKQFGENFWQKLSCSYNMATSILGLNSNYSAVYFKNNSELKCKNNVRLIPLRRSSMSLNSRSCIAKEEERNKEMHTGKEYCGTNKNNKIKEKHFNTNVFVISTKTNEYSNLDHIYYNICNNEYKSNHLLERPPHTSSNAQSSKIQSTTYFRKCDIIQDRSYELLNFYEIHNTKNAIHKKFELEKTDSGKTFVVQCNANRFHVLETLTGVQRECCIINQATEKRIRFECPDERSLRENKGYTELSSPYRRTKHPTGFQDNDHEYSKYRVLDPVLSLENSISKFRSRIETTLRKRRDSNKKNSRRISQPETTSSDTVNPVDSSELKKQGILKQHENDITKNRREISSTESRNRGILKMNEHDDKKAYNEISPSQSRNRKISSITPEKTVTTVDSQTSPIDFGNCGIVKLPKQDCNKMHCLTPLEPRNTDITRRERNLRQRPYCPTSPPVSRMRDVSKSRTRKNSKSNSQREEPEVEQWMDDVSKNRNISNTHKMSLKKKGAQNSPLDLPSKGVVKLQERSLSKWDCETSSSDLELKPTIRKSSKRRERSVKKKDSQTSPLNIRNRSYAKKRERIVKKKDSQTSPLKVKNKGSMHSIKTTDSQTSPLDLKNKNISKQLKQDVKKKDSQTSPIDLRKECTPQMQEIIIKIRDSETSPIDLVKRKTVIECKDDIKKRDSQTSPIDLTKNGDVRRHSGSIKRKDSATSPIDLTKNDVAKLSYDDIKTRDSETSPFNLRNGDIEDEEEELFEPKPENYQYRPKTKSEESIKPGSNGYQYWPKEQHEKSFESQYEDDQESLNDEDEESLDSEDEEDRYWPQSKYVDPECDDCQYCPEYNYSEPVVPNSTDYIYGPKMICKESFGSNYGNVRPIKRKCDKESDIIDCFKRASRRRLGATRCKNYEQRRKISSYSRQPNKRRKIKGRRIRWKCTTSNDNVLSNIVKKSKCHFERISSNPRPLSLSGPGPRSMGCRKKLVCPPLSDNKRQMFCNYDYGSKNKEHLTYSDFKVFTKEELQWIISNCSDPCSETCSDETESDFFRKNITSEEEMMFYCDYASMYKDLCSKNSGDWEGIKFHVRPNRCASKKWWSIFRTIF